MLSVSLTQKVSLFQDASEKIEVLIAQECGSPPFAWPLLPACPIAWLLCLRWTCLWREKSERASVVCRHPAYFPGSTNPLDLYAIWPGEWSTKGMAALAQRTVLAMGALGSWQQGNALPEMVPAAVRAGVEPGWILGNLSARVNATMAQSGVMAEGAETQGATQVSAAQHPVLSCGKHAFCRSEFWRAGGQRYALLLVRRWHNPAL